MSENRASSQLKPGSRLGKYRIQHLIGCGQKAEVYRAAHPDYKHSVALKILHTSVSQTSEVTVRFQQEAAALVALKHPNIVRMYDFGLNGMYYIAMEMISGPSLRDIVSAHPTGMDRDDVLRIFSQIASAVAYAHDQGVVHGNINPDSIMLDDNKRPVLTGFRVRCLLADTPDTVQESMPAYLAPEQAARHVATPASDIYALSIVLYEMITGDVPFKGDLDSVLDQHKNAPPKPPSEISVGLDPRIERVILKGLNKNPADRFASARDMLADLERKEEFNQFETLSFDRTTAGLLRKRQSEIRRFEMSRTDIPIQEPIAAGQSGPPIPLVIAAMVLAVTLVIVIILLLL